MLGLDTSVQLLKLIDVSESDLDERQQQLWIAQLNQKHKLGLCPKGCQGGILAIEYNLENSQLSILTANIEKQPSSSHYYALPEQEATARYFDNNSIGVNPMRAITQAVIICKPKQV